MSKTGRDDAFTGGFAGGERGLWSYRDELAATNAAEALEKAKAKRRETREVRLQKDFGGMAGGFPGGEIGVKSFNATGEVPAAKPPTGRAKATRGRAAAGDDSGDDVDEIIAPSRRGTRGTQNTSTQGTQNTWGRSRRSSGA